MADDIWRWSATCIAAAIRERDISPREALESCLDRMAAVNPMLNAVTVDLSDAAYEAARRADAAIVRGLAAAEAIEARTRSDHADRSAMVTPVHLDGPPIAIHDALRYRASSLAGLAMTPGLQSRRTRC